MKKIRHIVIFEDDIKAMKKGRKTHWSKSNPKTGKEEVDVELEYFPTVEDYIKICEEKKSS